jgi:hypothetical protein
MPFWHGEYMARSFHLSHRIGELRRTVAGVDPDDEAALDELATRYSADRATVRSLVGYVREQRAVCGSVPDDRELVLEHFRDEVGAVRIVLHAPFGGRVNAPWGMAMAQRVREALGTGNGERGTERSSARPSPQSRVPSPEFSDPESPAPSPEYSSPAGRTARSTCHKALRRSRVNALSAPISASVVSSSRRRPVRCTSASMEGNRLTGCSATVHSCEQMLQ